MEVTWEIAGGSHWKREKVFLHTLKSASRPEHNNWLGGTWRSGRHSFLCYSRPYYLGQGFSPSAAVGFPASSGQGMTRGIEPHSRFCPYLWEQGKGETLLTHATGTQGWVRETVIRVPASSSCCTHLLIQQAHRTTKGWLSPWCVSHRPSFPPYPFTPDLQSGSLQLHCLVRQLKHAVPKVNRGHSPGEQQTLIALAKKVKTSFPRKAGLQEVRRCKNNSSNLYKAATRRNWRKRAVSMEARKEKGAKETLFSSARSFTTDA